MVIASMLSVSPTDACGFKQTEAGIIPVAWNALPLGEVVQVTQLGGNYANSLRQTRWPLIKMGNMGRGKISLDKIEFVTAKTLPQQRDKLRRGDVLFNTRNTLELVGKVCIWNDELHEAYFNSNIMRFRFRPEYIASQRYMNYILNSGRAVSDLRGIATGTTSVAAIYTRDLFRIYVPIPPKVEQKAIAKALSDADAVIESLEALIEKKRLIKQGAMQELLSGRRRLPGFSGQWTIEKFGNLATIRNQKVKTLGNLLASFCVELENIASNSGRLLGTSDATDRMSSKYCFRKGDVLFGRLRPYLRKFWQADREGVSSTEIWPLIPASDRLLPEYLYQTVQSEGFIEAASSSYGTHMPRSDWTALQDHEVAFPIDTDEQQAISAILSEMGSEIAGLEGKVEKARQIKQGMMQELLTGRVRLV